MSNNTNHIEADSSDSECDHKVTPFEVSGSVDYTKLIRQFGCDPICANTLKRFETVTGVRVHPWLRRGIFFSQKGINDVLDAYEKGERIYIYTGRGPSSEAMHLGHMIPMLFTAWLQKVFDAIVVLQFSDDEKYLFKGKTDKKPLRYYNKLTYENARDVIACGFNPDKTFFFSNLTTVGGQLYENVVELMTTTGNQIKGIYGLTTEENTEGQIAWPAFQCAPGISSSFPDILHPDGPYSEELPDGTKYYTGPCIRCLVPMAIDQDPYFRMLRDHVEKFKSKGLLKPSTIHTKFLTGLLGANGKMSSTGASVESTTVYMTDDVKSIRKKIKTHAFSGGGETKELQQKYGADLRVDVSYQWLLYFLESDEELANIARKYRSGEMMTGQVKDITANVVCDLVQKHQEERARITDELLKKFFTRNRKFDLSVAKREKLEPLPDETYATYGINFDHYFGTDPYVGPKEGKDDGENEEDDDEADNNEMYESMLEIDKKMQELNSNA